MTHRGFHVDQKTFAGWKLALTAADAQEAHFEKIQTEMQLKLQQAQASKVESEFNMTQIQRSLQSAHQTIQNLNKQARLQDAKVVEKDLHWKKLDAEKTQLIKALQKQTALQKQVEASVAPILLQQHQIFPEEEQVDISPYVEAFYHHFINCFLILGFCKYKTSCLNYIFTTVLSNKISKRANKST